MTAEPTEAPVHPHERMSSEIEAAAQLTRLMAEHQDHITSLGHKRAAVLAQLHAGGVQVRFLATKLGLSEAQVHKMLKRERDRVAAR